MTTSTVPLESVGIQLAFKVLDGSDRHFTTAIIPIEDNYQIQNSSLTKAICEKCNEGELVFNPSAEELENLKISTYRHTCTNCDNEENLETIYPFILLCNKNDIDKIETIKISIEPVFRKDII